MSKWLYLTICMVLMTVFMVIFGIFVAQPVGLGFANWLIEMTSPAAAAAIVMGIGLAIGAWGLWAERN